MINLTNETDLIIDALKTKVETMTTAINEAINSNIGGDIVDLLKDKQDKLNELIDKIDNAIEEEDVHFALLDDDEIFVLNE